MGFSWSDVTKAAAVVNPIAALPAAIEIIKPGSVSGALQSAAGTVQGWDPTVVRAPDYSRVSAAQERIRKSRGQRETEMKRFAGRAAPQMAKPQDIRRTDVRDVAAPTISWNIGLPSYSIDRTDMSQSNMSREQQMKALELQAAAAAGNAPSQAQALLSQAMAQQARQAMGLALARGGYNPAAVRGAQYQMAQAGQESAGQLGALRAQEMAQAREAYMTGAQGLRGTDLQAAELGQQLNIKQAELKQGAEIFKTTAEGQKALAAADMGLKAQLANQGVDLDVLKFNAARGDAAALANLEATLKQNGMNDAMTLAYLETITGQDQSDLAAEMTKAGLEAGRLGQVAAQRSKYFDIGLATLGDIVKGAASAGGGGAPQT